MKIRLLALPRQRVMSRFPFAPLYHPRMLLTGFALLVGSAACAGGDMPAPAAGTGVGTGGIPVAMGGTAPSAGMTSVAGASAGMAASGGGAAGAAGQSTALGGSAGEQVAGAGGAADEAPPIDYSVWQLQLPIGDASPQTVSSKQLLGGFSNEYFYVAEDGARIFMDPQTGVTTSGSQHCRTEMREVTAQGSAAAWPSTGNNVLTVSGKVLQVGGGNQGKVTVGQVFNGTDSIPLCELEYSNGRGGFELLYEEAKGAGTTTDLKTPVALGEKYTFALALSAGVLTLNVNGKQVYSRTPSAATAAKKFYFKFGNYDQTATSGPVSTVPYSVVAAYSAVVVHAP